MERSHKKLGVIVGHLSILGHIKHAYVHILWKKLDDKLMREWNLKCIFITYNQVTKDCKLCNP